MKNRPSHAILVMFLASSFSWACGSSPRRKAPQHSPVITHQGGTPLYLALEDRDCTEDDAVPHLGSEVAVTFYDQQKPVVLQLDLSRLSGQGLRSQAIHSTQINARYLYKRNYHDHVPRVREGERLPFCRSGGGYQRFSVENAALAAAYGILEASDAYERLRLHLALPPLPAVTLLVQPETIEESRSQSSVIRRTLTDNATWFMAIPEDKFYISILAHSRERNDFYPGKFWEQPAVLSHEYAHHIFYHRAYGRLLTPSSAPVYSDDPGSGRKQVKPGQRILSGIEEGFADLFAYLVYQSKPNRAFSGKLQFSLGRDVESRLLLRRRGMPSNLYYKVLDHKFLLTYLSPAEEAPLSEADLYEQLQDEHCLGAIVAYGLHRFYRASLKPTRPAPLLSPSAQSEAELILLLKWAQALAVMTERIRAWDGEQGESLLSEVLYAAIAVSMQNPGAAEPSSLLSKEQCQALEGAFPVFYQEWSAADRLPGCLESQQRGA